MRFLHFWIFLYFTVIGADVMSMPAEEEEQVCGPLTNLGNLLPHELYISPQSDLTLNCTLNRNGTFRSSSIMFEYRNHRKNTKLEFYQPSKEIQIINDYKAALTIRKANIDKAGEYICKVRHGDKNYFVCTSEVMVGCNEKPAPVKGFSCAYHYKRHLKCAWPVRKKCKNIKTKATLIGHYENNTIFQCDNKVLTGKETICVWKKTDMYLPNYRFDLKSSNKFGKTIQTFAYNLSTIVYFDAPPNLSFNSQTNTLSWDYPNDIDHNEELFKLLEFKILIHEIERGANSDKIFLNHKQKSKRLDNLKPEANYRFNLSCKIHDEKNVLWSRVSSIVGQSRNEIPQFAPTIIPESFEVTNQSRFTKDITIFWQQPPSSQKHISFSINLINLSIPKSKPQNFTTEERNFTFDNLNNSHNYLIEIFAENIIGRSLNHAKLILNSKTIKSSISSKIHNFSVLIKENSYKISWNKSLKPQNYTIFWCRQSQDNKCDGEINWKLTNKTYLKLNLPKDENYRFGISGTKFPGIQWTNCVVRLPIHKWHNIFAETMGHDQIKISWKFLCNTQRNLIKNYMISYSTPDRSSFGMENFLTPTNDEIVLTNLEPNSTYRIEISSKNVTEDFILNKRTDIGIPQNVSQIEVNFTEKLIILKWNISSPVWLEYFKINIAPENGNQKIKSEIDFEDCSKNVCELPFESSEFKSYEYYSAEILSCNKKNVCSENVTVNFQTLPSKPGKIRQFIVRKINRTHYEVNFDPPDNSNGPIDFYYVRTISETLQNLTKSFPGNISNKVVTIDAGCQSMFDAKNFQINIFASNLRYGKELPGELSDPIRIFRLCVLEYWEIWMIVIAIVGILVFFIVLILLYVVGYHCSIAREKSKETIPKPKFNHEYRSRSDSDEERFRIFEQNRPFYPNQSLISPPSVTSDSSETSLICSNQSNDSDIESEDQSHEIPARVERHFYYEIPNKFPAAQQENFEYLTNLLPQTNPKLSSFTTDVLVHSNDKNVDTNEAIFDGELETSFAATKSESFVDNANSQITQTTSQYEPHTQVQSKSQTNTQSNAEYMSNNPIPSTSNSTYSQLPNSPKATNSPYAPHAQFNSTGCSDSPNCEQNSNTQTKEKSPYVYNCTNVEIFGSDVPKEYDDEKCCENAKKAANLQNSPRNNFILFPPIDFNLPINFAPLNFNVQGFNQATNMLYDAGPSTSTVNPNTFSDASIGTTGPTTSTIVDQNEFCDASIGVPSGSNPLYQQLGDCASNSQNNHLNGQISLISETFISNHNNSPQPVNSPYTTLESFSSNNNSPRIDQNQNTSGDYIRLENIETQTSSSDSDDSTQTQVEPLSNQVINQGYVSHKLIEKSDN